VNDDKRHDTAYLNYVVAFQNRILHTLLPRI
jgi:hypothetical protein